MKLIPYKTAVFLLTCKADQGKKSSGYGISQGRLAVASGITREYLNKIESGKMKPSKELLETLHKELAKFNPEALLTMLFDYVKIRFPTLDIQHIIKDILKLNINYMLHPDCKSMIDVARQKLMNDPTFKHLSEDCLEFLISTEFCCIAFYERCNHFSGRINHF